VLDSDEALLYVDFFGLKSDYIRNVLAPHYRHQLIVDNAQALFTEPLPGIATLYSPRKFVGVADGGWLVNAPDDLPPFAASSSLARFSALLGRLEDSPQQHYAAFQDSELALQTEGIKAISVSTARVLDSLDYTQIARQRMANLAQLRQRLDPLNRFSAWPAQRVAALCYPLLLACADSAERLRRHLLEQTIFVPCYWQEVLSASATPDTERSWAQCLLALPIDQRYSVDDMNRLADIILQHTRTS
ncbi:MAG: hypothetical protein ACRERW_09150, partial [Pseudomonas sp.]